MRWPERTVITLEHVELENSLLALSLVEPRTRGYAICHAISNIPLERPGITLYSDKSFQKHRFKGCVKSLGSNNRISLCS